MILDRYNIAGYFLPGQDAASLALAEGYENKKGAQDLGTFRWP